MTPFFSIIIPARNIHKLLIDETLPAINDQSFPSFETIIAVDKRSRHDHRLTGTYDWLRIIQDDQITRPGDKRDAAAAIAKGKILVFIDDDVFPTPHWLAKAHEILQNTDIAALGGPGILPEKVNLWERIFDAVLKTWVGSGRYVYRFTPQKKRFVDDYPTMNLMIRKNIFDKIGGFDNQHWPGEDSKLLNKFITQEKKFILYHPDVAVYHHRRSNLRGHLEQHKNYGKTRGTFAAHGDQNSTHMMYIIPALFTVYICALILIWIFDAPFMSLIAIGLYLYLGLLSYVFFETYLRTEHLLITIGAVLIIPLTHLTYGFWFIVGYIKEKLF